MRSICAWSTPCGRAEQRERVVVAHVVRVVGAEQHVVGAVEVDQVLQLAGLEDHGVEEELAQVGGGRLRDALTHVLARAPAVVEPSRVGRQVAAAVHHEDLEAGMAFDDAVEDQMRGGEGGFERVADDVDEVVVLHPLRMGGSLRVDDDDESECLDLGPERVEALAGDLLALDVGADLDTAHAEIACEVTQFLDGRLGVLQGHGAQRLEAPRVPCRCLDELLVHQPRDLGPELGVGPVVVLVDRHRDRLDVHAHAVHVGDADIQHVHLRFDRLELAPVHRLGYGVAMAEGHLAGRAGRVGHHLGRRCALSMAMDVDDRTVATERPDHAVLLPPTGSARA